MTDFARLILRLTVGTLMAGHGAQKLFGWFDGPGLKGTHGFMESLGMKPGPVWGTMVAAGETSGGVLTALGFLSPLGPLNIASAMVVAIRRAHWNKPVWNMNGGAEFPLTNLSVATALVLTGPGRYSLDRAFGIRLPRVLTALAWFSTVAITGIALRRPEIAQQVVDRATEVTAPIAPVVSKATELVASFQATTEPDLAVESRPVATPAQVSSEAEIR